MEYQALGDYSSDFAGTFTMPDLERLGISTIEESSPTKTPVSNYPIYSQINRKRDLDIHPRITGASMGAGRQEWNGDFSQYGVQRGNPRPHAQRDNFSSGQENYSRMQWQESSNPETRRYIDDLNWDPRPPHYSPNSGREGKV